jgi:hypothetical protein
MQSTHRAVLSQPKLMRGTTEPAEKRKLSFTLPEVQSANMHDRCSPIRTAHPSASGTLTVRQIKRQSFVAPSCSTKRPDRDEDLMKMRRVRACFEKL